MYFTMPVLSPFMKQEFLKKGMCELRDPTKAFICKPLMKPGNICLSSFCIRYDFLFLFFNYRGGFNEQSSDLQINIWKSLHFPAISYTQSFLHLKYILLGPIPRISDSVGLE